MNDTATGERPVAITIICILGFIGAALSIPAIFMEATSMVGAWYPPYVAFSAVVGLVCMIGLWKMQKWSVFAYTALVILNQCVHGYGILEHFCAADSGDCGRDRLYLFAEDEVRPGRGLRRVKHTIQSISVVGLKSVGG